MAILKFRAYWEDDDSIYRDVAIRHSQTFTDLHSIILKSYEFDNKHKATFYRSNDHWLRGREISLEKYADKQYKAEPLIMSETLIGSEVKDPNQKFVYVYDSRLAEVEEKYDLNSEALSDGFSEEGEDGEREDSTEEATTDEGNDGF